MGYLRGLAGSHKIYYGMFQEMWESAGFILGCLGESQKQSKAGIEIHGRGASVGKWRREEIKEVSCMKSSYALCLIITVCLVFLLNSIIECFPV